MNITALQDQLRAALPSEQHELIQPLTQILVGVIERTISLKEAQDQSTQFVTLLKSLAGKELRAGDSLVSFGTGNSFGNVTIGDITGGHKISITIKLPLPPPPAPHLHQLRAPVGDFVGRQREVEELVVALQNTGTDGAVATIGGVSGMGGIGKTELAYVVAQKLKDTFFDGQLLVELRGVRNPLTPEQVLQEILYAFEPEAKLPDSLTKLTVLYRSRLADKRILILADDAGYRKQIIPLMPPPGSALLITSRKRFTIPGMKAINLGIFPPKQAKVFLLKICPRIGKHAARLAKLCGYLPLALRVSAGLLEPDPSKDVVQYLEQLQQERLKHLSDPDDPDDPDDPQASVEASLQLSYTSLDPSIQDALCQSSVFPTSFDLAAAKEIIITKEAIEEALGKLLRHCLLEWNQTTKRYNLHDLIHAFGATRLKNTDSIRWRHAQYYVKVVAHAQNDLYMEGGTTLAGLMLFDQERIHIESGWEWAQKQAGNIEGDLLLLSYATATDLLGEVRYHPEKEYIPRFKVALQAARRAKKQDEECLILANLGDSCLDIGEPLQAIDFYEQAIVIACEINDQDIESWGLGGLGWAYMIVGKGHQAVKFCEEALTIARTIGNEQGECSYLNTMGRAYATLGNHQQAIECSQQCIKLACAVHDSFWESAALGNLAREYVKIGKPDWAIELANKALLIRRGLGDKWGEAEDLSNLGSAYARIGDLSHAVELFDQAIAIAGQIYDKSNLAEYHRDLGNVLAQQGNLKRAVEVMQLYVDYWHEINHENVEEADAHLAQLCQQLANQSGEADI